MEGYQPKKKMRIKKEVDKAQDTINEIEIKSHLISYAKEFEARSMLGMGYNEQLRQEMYSKNQVLDALVNFAAKMIIDYTEKENIKKDEIIRKLEAERDIYKDLYMKEITPINKNSESTPIKSITFLGVKKEIAAKEPTPQPKYKFTIEFSENDDLEFIEKLNKLKEFWVQQQK